MCLREVARWCACVQAKLHGVRRSLHCVLLCRLNCAACQQIALHLLPAPTALLRCQQLPCPRYQRSERAAAPQHHAPPDWSSQSCLTALTLRASSSKSKVCCRRLQLQAAVARLGVQKCADLATGCLQRCCGQRPLELLPGLRGCASDVGCHAVAPKQLELCSFWCLFCASLTELCTRSLRCLRFSCSSHSMKTLAPCAPALPCVTSLCGLLSPTFWQGQKNAGPALKKANQINLGFAV